MKNRSHVRKILIGALILACLIPNFALLALVPTFAEGEIVTPQPIVEPDTLPAFSVTVPNDTTEGRDADEREARKTYTGVETENVESYLGSTTYQTYVNALVDAMLHLVRYESKGNEDFSGLSCTIDGVTTDSDYNAVYNAVYDLLLQVKTTVELPAGSSSAPTIAESEKITYIYRIESEQVSIKADITIKGNARYIIIASGKTKIVQWKAASFFVLPSDDAKQKESVLAILGKKIVVGEEEKGTIEYCGSVDGGTYTTRSDDLLRVKSGSLYMRYVDMHDFRFSGSQGTIVLPNGGDYARFVYMTKSSMDNHIGTDAPGIFCKAYNGANDKNTQKSRLYLYDCEFKNCWSKMTGTPALGGAVIRSYAADRSVLEARKCTFFNNVSGSRNGNRPDINATTNETLQPDRGSSGGGAVYWKSARGEAKLIGCTFEKNLSTVLGGAVFNTGKMTIQGCLFTDNKAYGWGGAIAVEPPNTTTDYASISGNKDILNGLSGSLTLDEKTVIQNNTAILNGGGIYFNALTSWIKKTETTTNGVTTIEGNKIEEFRIELKIDGATIQNNTAQNGGGVAINLNYEDNNYINGVTIFPGSKILNNTATNEGGAIWMNSTENCNCKSSSGVLIKARSAEDKTLDRELALVSGNKAAYGGAFYINAGKTGEGVNPMNFVMQDGVVQGNTATNADETVGMGGAVYLNGGNLTVNQGIIQDNDALQNGGFAYLAGGSLTLQNGTVALNEALQNGGFAYLAGGTLNVSGGSIYQNSATQNGGVAYLGNGEMNVLGGSITQNQAVDGGVFYLLDGEMNITGGEITDNTATNDGGFAYLLNGNMTVSGADTLISNNKAERNGGVVCIGGDGSLTVSGGTITQNQAVDGGAFYLLDGEITVSGDTSISENTALHNGGAVYLGGGELRVFGGSFVRNSAVEYGGAIYLEQGTMTMSGGEILENTAAKDGGAAYLGGGSLSMSGGVVSLNAAVNGGGFYVTDDGTANQGLTISGGSITQNTASGSGGGAYVKGGGVTVSGTANILQNTAAENGGGIAIYDGNYTMTGGNVNGNVATNGQGGGIFISSGGADVAVLVESGSICDNATTGTDGGAIAVIGVEDAEQKISVVIGVNAHHEYDTSDKDYPNVTVTCDAHDPAENGCPRIQGNSAITSGGGIYIAGGSNTTLTIYCLIEDSNSNDSELGDVNSHFMMVEGGTILITTLEKNPADPENPAATHGFVVMNSSIHVKSGAVDVKGAMSNPVIKSNVVIDIISKDEGYFDDDRDDDGLFYKVQYYENFDGTGRYKVFSAMKGEEITISGTMYLHTGYEIKGWYTNDDGTGDKLEVNGKYTFDKNGDKEGVNYIRSNLVVYAHWEAVAYFIVFDSNPYAPEDTVYQSMPNQALVYGVSDTIDPNLFIYPGYRFTGWYSVTAKQYYDPEEVVLNLSTTTGTKLVFQAQWEICDHSTYYAYSTYIVNAEGEAGAIERMCPCHGYYERVDIILPQGAVYNGSGYTATPSPRIWTVGSRTITRQDPDWTPTLSYAGSTLASYEAPTNAGTYTVTFGAGGLTAYVTFVIDKAVHTQTPEKPTYTGEGQSLTIYEPTDTTGFTIEYQLRWYSGSTLVPGEWDPARQYTLTENYTNYYVFARYAATDNYYASEVAVSQADKVYFYKGSVSFELTFASALDAERLFYFFEEPSDQQGLYVRFLVKDGFYATDEINNLSTSSLQIQIREEEAYQLFLLTNIPTPPGGQTQTITVTVADGSTAIKVAPASKIEAGEVFGIVADGSSAVISRDSAYTAYFEISQYDSSMYVSGSMKLLFSSVLPEGTTLLLLDKSGDLGLWYFVVENNSTEMVPMQSFVKMGDANKTPFAITDDADTLKFQIIISFSQVLSANLLDNDTRLSTTIEADPTEGFIPVLHTTVEAVLKKEPTFSLTVKNNDGNALKKTIEVKFAESENDVSASKWEALAGAIVLRDTGAEERFPTDLHVVVSVGTGYTTYYQNAQGVFIIPLSGQGSTTLEIELKSDAFPDAAKTYRMTAMLYVSKSGAAKSPMNGECEKQIEEISFNKAEQISPALKVTGTERLVGYMESLTVHVEYAIPSNYTVTVELWQRRKDEKGQYKYTDTSFTLSEPKSGEPYTLENFAALIDKEMPIQSVCLMFFVRDANQNVVFSVPYYFVLADTQ